MSQYLKTSTGVDTLSEVSTIIHDTKLNVHMIRFSNGFTIYYGESKTVNNYGQGSVSHNIVFFSVNTKVNFIDTNYTVTLTPMAVDGSVISDVYLESKTASYFTYCGIAHTVNCTVQWVATGFTTIS